MSTWEDSEERHKRYVAKHRPQYQEILDSLKDKKAEEVNIDEIISFLKTIEKEAIFCFLVEVIGTKNRSLSLKLQTDKNFCQLIHETWRYEKEKYGGRFPWAPEFFKE